MSAVAWIRRSAVLLCLAAVLACDDTPTAPAPATYDVVLGRGNAHVGAILFLIEGGAVDTVEGVGYYTATAPFSGVATQVLVASPDLNGVLVRVRVPDSRVRYQAVAREVAELGTHGLLPVGDYALTLTPVFR
jgi:hypothetical protein